MAKTAVFKILLVLCIVVQFQHGFVRVKRVIGGEPDESSDFGFLAALIGTKGYYWDILNVWGEYQNIYCSGALINDQWIVTAAHCFTMLKEIEEDTGKQYDKSPNLEDEDEIEEEEERIKGVQSENRNLKKKAKPAPVREVIDFSDPNLWKVRLAVQTLKPTLKEKFINFVNQFLNKSTTNTYYEISKVIRHPKYTPWNLENDVALVKLTSKLNISSDGHPRILPLASYNESTSLWPPTGQLCKVIGWGCKEFEGPIMNKPHSVNLPILSPDYCRKIYRTDINLTDHQEFCAGYYGQDKGICAGDSGGPLLCSENESTVLAGVVSATHIDNPSKYPGIFSRISYFKQWINEVIQTD